MSWITRIWSQGATEEEALENIQDAIAGYLSVVNELTQESETRYLEVIESCQNFREYLTKERLKLWKKQGFV